MYGGFTDDQANSGSGADMYVSPAGLVHRSTPDRAWSRRHIPQPFIR